MPSDFGKLADEKKHSRSIKLYKKNHLQNQTCRAAWLLSNNSLSMNSVALKKALIKQGRLKVLRRYADQNQSEALQIT